MSQRDTPTRAATTNYIKKLSDPGGTVAATGRATDPSPAPAPSHRKEALSIMDAATDTNLTTPAARARLALAILQQRAATERTIELAVMALRGADIETLTDADRQLAEQ